MLLDVDHEAIGRIVGLKNNILLRLQDRMSDGELREHFEGRASVIAVDDLQWLDSASWALLRRVQRELPNVFVAISTRLFEHERDAPADYQALCDDKTTTVLFPLPLELMGGLGSDRGPSGEP